MILLKLGGSIITNKSRPLSPRRKAIDKIAKILTDIDEPVVLVHGGGSYGHYWSVKYDMHTKPHMYDSRGVATVKNSMVELDRIVLDILAKNDINPYCLPPASFMQGSRPEEGKIRMIKKIAESNLVPVTFGDALWHGQGKTYILSGDKIMTHMAKVLKPRLCIFALNEDGVYSNLKTKTLIEEYKNEKLPVMQSGMDVTGGMARKIEESIKISRAGVNVFLVNGSRPERILDAVKNSKFYGTTFRGSSHG